jgi:hypothetical protein
VLRFFNGPVQQFTAPEIRSLEGRTREEGASVKLLAKVLGGASVTVAVMIVMTLLFQWVQE